MENSKKYKPKTRDELLQSISEHFGRGKTNLNDIDTSLITDMSKLFVGTKINFDVSEWNTSNVENMHGMFLGCQKFNCDISRWDTGKVKNMYIMLYYCSSFNQDIGKWNVGSVINMVGMFYYCSSFNQDLSKWSTRGIANMEDIFLMCQIKEEWKPRYINLYSKNK